MSSSRTRHTLAAVATLALSAGTFTSCAEDEPDDPAGAAEHRSSLRTVSKTEFAEKGNELCRANAEAVGSKFATMSQPPEPDELTDAFETMLRESYKITGDVLAIGVPQGQEAELIDLLVEMNEVTKSVEQQGQQAFFAEESDPWAAATQRLVEDFGLTDCQPQD